MSSQPLRPGDPEHLGGYVLESRLGAGGMGTVFLGRTPQGRPVAVKVVRAEYIRDEEFLGRFRSEVNRARQVPPFCTAEVLDADLDHEPPYLVVEYVDGPTLTDVVRERGPLSPAALHSAAVGIATALTAIHGAGVIHRDLKPGNVLFALGGLKVIDFGIARPLEATSQHTRTDQMVGTVAYMAPERFDEQPAARVSPAADIFAWGAVVVFAATGRTPFQGDSAPATAMRILTQQPDLTGVPARLSGIVARALAKDPADRPTARELLDLLLADGAAAGLPVAGQPPTGPLSGRPIPGQAPIGQAPIGQASAGQAPAGQAPAGQAPAGQAPAGQAPAGQAVGRQHGGPPPRPAVAGASSSGSAPVPVRQGEVAVPPDDRFVAAPRPRRRLRVFLAALVVLGILAGGGWALARNAGLDQGGDTGQAPGPDAGAASGTASSRPGAAPSPVQTGTPAILAGDRRTLIHFVEIDRDLAMPFPDEVVASDGTGKDALFALVPTGVDHMIQSVQPTDGEPPCLGVKVIPGGSAKLVATECAATKATLFSVDGTGDKDDKGRPTYTIYNDAHGFVQWWEEKSEVYVEHTGDAAPDDTFSFVDRGPV
ncbi:serine/threonine protein kinase [Actinoplanes sp. NPDC049599]|uniref:serine/threonine protein kinase n=1 Tax=Actinoplanes sp. NPDC049599 TaxID=3363903 RepID=UPI0037A9E8BD